MKKIILAIASIVITQVLPLLGKPEYIFKKQNIVIMIANAIVWLTQPPVSKKETEENKTRDQSSVLMILFFSLSSIIISVVEWAYLKNGFYSNNFIITGVILLILGISFRAWAVQTLGKYFTATIQIQQDHKLITKGPYTFVRHPSYLGAWLMISGMAVYFQSYAGIIISVCGMGVSYYFRMKLEEKSLTEMFGQQYIDYQKKVKKILPYIW